MQHHSDTDGPSPLATAGLLLLPVLCCGLPLLIAGGAPGGLGAVLGNPWIIAAAAVVVGVVAFRMRRVHRRVSVREGTGRCAATACPAHPAHANPAR